jgi:GTP-binding protein
VTVVVVDATRLERNLNLALQVLEITDRAVVCLNLIDEARRHGLQVDDRPAGARSRRAGRGRRPPVAVRGWTPCWRPSLMSPPRAPPGVPPLGHTASARPRPPWVRRWLSW